VLELRSVRGTGGGPEKTILLGTAAADPARFAITVCYIRDRRDAQFEITGRAAAAGIDYVEVLERHSLDPTIWPALRRLVRSRRIDIVHAHEYKTDLIAYLLSTVEPIVPLATAHAWTGHSWRETRLYYPADKRLLARFPQVIAVSSEIRGELLAAGADPAAVDVVLNGIDETRFRRDPARRDPARALYGLADGEIAIGSVGRLEPQKRFDLLIEAFAALHAGRPALRLLIAGEGSCRAALEAQIARLGLGGVCRLAGQTADISGFHHALDLFVQSSMYEGTPNVVLEGMALETPVVATDVGGTAELLRDGIDGWIVRPQDLAALTDAMRQALADPEATASRAAAARRRVERDLSFRTRMAKVEAIYERLMMRRRGLAEGVPCAAAAKL
jgi:glycosyltransferase involved in cell wall biosynthesis